MKKRPAILILDDEENVLKAVRRCLRGLDVTVETATNAQDALAAIRDRAPPLAAVISDERMPGLSGLEFLHRIRQISPSTVRILFTAYADMDLIIRSINIGEVFRFIRKPWDDAELRGAVASAIQHHELIVENDRLLRQVTSQQQTLAQLERQHPGITKLPPRDESGAFIIDRPRESPD